MVVGGHSLLRTGMATTIHLLGMDEGKLTTLIAV
jgi:hypothetical protein